VNERRWAKSDFDGPVLALARRLIGCTLVHETKSGRLAGRIVETEAYRGPLDLAAHSAGGRRTARTDAMFREAGVVYMFLLYGVHWAFNVVAGRVGEPHAVLVRAIEPVLGLERMADNRGISAAARRGSWTTRVGSGPGKVTRALELDGSHYGLRLWENGTTYVCQGETLEIIRTPRINVDYAGAWAQKPWRFVAKGSTHASRRPKSAPDETSPRRSSRTNLSRVRG
jgi:DNA-3-methyladenine glycosylase